MHLNKMPRQRDSYIVLGIMMMTLLTSQLVGCNSRKRASVNANPVISSVPPSLPNPFPSTVAPTPEEILYGEGDCAPRFAYGMRGTCINNKPCNGFGVKSKEGKVICECFGIRDGCPSETICSIMRRACVPPTDEKR